MKMVNTRVFFFFFKIVLLHVHWVSNTTLFMIFMYIFDIANSFPFTESWIMNIQITIRISSLGELSHYSNHQREIEYYFCFTLNKAN